MRYRANSIRIAARHQIAESQIATARKTAPTIKREPYPKSKDDRAARNERVPIDMSGGGRRTLWERPR